MHIGRSQILFTIFFILSCKTISQRSEVQEAMIDNKSLFYKVSNESGVAGYCLSKCKNTKVIYNEPTRRLESCQEEGAWLEESFVTRSLSAYDQATVKTLLGAAEDFNSVVNLSKGDEKEKLVIDALEKTYNQPGVTKGFPCKSPEFIPNLSLTGWRARRQLCQETKNIEMKILLIQNGIAFSGLKLTTCVSIYNGAFTNDHFFECATEQDALDACKKWAKKNSGFQSSCSMVSPGCRELLGPFPANAGGQNVYIDTLRNQWTKYEINLPL